MNSVTIILPAHNEAAVIEEAINAIEAVLSAEHIPFEFLVVDDGSTDNTWEVVSRLTRTNPRLHAISLSRNFGKEHAILAGIRATVTDLAIVMDADLQHPPELIPNLLERWRETSCDVVHAVKTTRDNESARGKLMVNAFYSTHRLFTGLPLRGASDYKLLNRRALDTYANLTERDLFFRGMVPWLGFHQETVPFTVAKRAAGTTKWNPLRRCALAIQTITSFSTLPLQIVTLIGVVFLVGSLLVGSFTIYQWWTGVAVEGFTTVILLLLLVGATLMISLGIIGQYIARIYEEVKGRPAYIVKDHIKQHRTHD